MARQARPVRGLLAFLLKVAGPTLAECSRVLDMPGRVGGFLIAMALAGSGTGPAAAADLFVGVRGKIQAGLGEHGVPSMSIAVARDGKIIWEEAFGLADVERRVKATPRTMYSLASISKPFTATGLMILVERGRMDLDRPLNDYLGKAKIRGLAGDASAATPRRVGSHTSGLPLHYQFYMADESYPLPTMEEAIRRYGILVTKPGERYQYSNIGFGILGYALGRVAGKSYEQFMREEVFEPLGLENTEIPSAAPARPWAVRYGDEKTALPFYDFDHRGASAVFASAHDLVRFGMLHVKTPMRDQKRILSDASIDEMQQAIGGPDASQRYGIGWMLYADLGGLRVVHHGGSMGGVRTQLSLVPDEKVVVVVLANRHSSFVDEIRDEILSAMFPNFRKRRAAQLREKTTAGGCQDMDDGSVPAKFVGEWAGHVTTYQGRLPINVGIGGEGGVSVELNGGERTKARSVKLCGDALAGAFDGDIGTADANRRTYELRFLLQHRGTTLIGPISAVSLPRSGSQGAKLGNALTSWLELEAVDR